MIFGALCGQLLCGPTALDETDHWICWYLNYVVSDVVCATETWLSDSCPDAVTHLPNFVCTYVDSFSPLKHLTILASNLPWFWLHPLGFRDACRASLSKSSIIHHLIEQIQKHSTKKAISLLETIQTASYSCDWRFKPDQHRVKGQFGPHKIGLFEILIKVLT